MSTAVKVVPDEITGQYGIIQTVPAGLPVFYSAPIVGFHSGSTTAGTGTVQGVQSFGYNANTFFIEAKATGGLASFTMEVQYSGTEAWKAIPLHRYNIDYTTQQSAGYSDNVNNTTAYYYVDVNGQSISNIRCNLGLLTAGTFDCFATVSSTLMQPKHGTVTNYSSDTLAWNYFNSEMVTAQLIGFNGSYSDRVRVGKVYKYIEFLTLANGTDTAVWTPTAGRKFRLMGVAMSSSVANNLHLKDGSTIFHTSRFANNNTNTFDFGNGYLSSAANNILYVSNATGSTAAVWVTAWGTEE